MSKGSNTTRTGGSSTTRAAQVSGGGSPYVSEKEYNSRMASVDSKLNNFKLNTAPDKLQTIKFPRGMYAEISGGYRKDGDMITSTLYNSAGQQVVEGRYSFGEFKTYYPSGNTERASVTKGEYNSKEEAIKAMKDSLRRNLRDLMTRK